MITRRHVLHGFGLASLALAVGASSGCGTSHSEQLQATAAVMTLPLDGTPNVTEAAKASGRIAWELMLGSDATHTDNVAMSPSSLAVTLAMLTEGATDESLASLDEAIGLAGDDRSAAIGALRQGLQVYEDLTKKVDAHDPPEVPIVHQANRVVILDDTEVQERFLNRLASYYDTGVFRLPRAKVQSDLDGWAEEHTAGLVKESAIEVGELSRVIAQDVLLFAARWRKVFEIEDAPLAFVTGEDVSTDITALAGKFSIPHAAGNGWEAIRLAFDDVLAMDVILPEQGLHPEDLDFETIHESASALLNANERSVDVTMPQSDIQSTWDLLKPLAAQGILLEDMDSIFVDAIVNQVTQQVRLTVTAKGTVGAALTEADIGVGAAPVENIEFIADRPFVMRVLDTRTGWPLFLAIVNDPTVMPD